MVSQDGLSAQLESGKHVNHILHLILSFITLGIWVPMWILLSIFGRQKHQHLEVDECGFYVGGKLMRPFKVLAWEFESVGGLAGRVVTAAFMALVALMVVSIAISIADTDNNAPTETQVSPAVASAPAQPPAVESTSLQPPSDDPTPASAPTESPTQATVTTFEDVDWTGTCMESVVADLISIGFTHYEEILEGATTDGVNAVTDQWVSNYVGCVDELEGAGFLPSDLAEEARREAQNIIDEMIATIRADAGDAPSLAGPPGDPIVLSGQGNATAPINLSAGVWVVNGRFDYGSNRFFAARLIHLDGSSRESLFGEAAPGLWEGEMVLTVGGDRFGAIPPGDMLVEVEDDGAWTLTFTPTHATPAQSEPVFPSGDPIVLSGQGNATAPINLSAGVWVVNGRFDYGSNRFFAARLIHLDGSSRESLFGEAAPGLWEGEMVLTVGGDRFGAIPPGDMLVEVEDDGAWTLTFTPTHATPAQSEPVFPSGDPIVLSGQGNATAPINLSAGVWVVNGRFDYGSNRFFAARLIHLDGSSRESLFGEAAPGLWEGEMVLTVGGDRFGAIPPGDMLVEVEDDGAWTLTFTKWGQ